MKRIPIHLVISGLKRLTLDKQVCVLQELVKHEKPYSVRRNELQSLLEGKMLRLLKKESRAA